MAKVIDISSVVDQLRRDGEPPDNGDMEARLAKLESIAEKTSVQLTTLEQNVAVMKSNYATREDLYKSLNDQTWKVIGAMITLGTLLSGIVFFIARNVH